MKRISIQKHRYGNLSAGNMAMRPRCGAQNISLRLLIILIVSLAVSLLHIPASASVNTYLMPDHILLQVGERGSFSAPFGGKASDYEWTSGDEEVAVVYANGVVRAAGPGMATITASYGGNVGYGVVFVRDYAPSLVRSLTLSTNNVYLDIGQNTKVNATTTPTYARNHTVYYISTDSGIATVDDTGTVTGRSKGKATVYAYSADWRSWDGCKVYVATQESENDGENGDEEAGDDLSHQKPGWYYEKGVWVYISDGTSEPAMGWLQLDDGSYYFDQSGAMLTGWQQIDGNWHYFDSSGRQKYGWLQLGDGLYYVDDSGVMQTGWVELDDKWYHLDEKGRALTGWQSEDGLYRYYHDDGSMATGWLEANDAWYYLDADGIMQTGWMQYAGEWFYLREDGVMQVGWTEADGRWYFFRPNGSMHTGWYYDWQHWYYLNESGGYMGAMAVGWKKIDGCWFYLHPGGDGHATGTMATRWNTIDGQRYYFRYSGAMVTGWLYDGAEWYYFDAGGRYQSFKSVG